MVNYKLGKIYLIKSNRTTKIYIGSCCVKLGLRLSYHKQKKNSCSSKEIIDLGGNIEIVLIENYECNSKRELEKREQLIMNIYKTNHNVINKIKSYQTITDRNKQTKNYNKDNRRLEYHKNYNELNKEKKKNNTKKNYELNKDTINDKKKEVYFMNKYSNVISDWVNTINEY
tara:strand:- start:1 stop:516 length:516 start_codon:yes stop_codon:yes gene_type:complete